MQQKIDEGPLGLAQDHLLGIGDETHAGHFGVLQYLGHTFDAIEQLLDIAEVTVARQFHGRDAIGDGTHGFQKPRCQGKMCFMYQSSVVGMLTKRSDSAVGAQSSTTTS